MSNTSLKASGYYGKVPVLGDFIKYNLPRSFINPWDDWLQSAMIQSQAKLAKDWIEFYLSSPIYYFALSPGICGEISWLGLIKPSADSAGRYFPLTLCKPIIQQVNPLTILNSNQSWCSQVEMLAASSNKYDFTIKKFEQGLQELDRSNNQDSIPENSICDSNEPARNHLTMRHPLDSIASLPQLYNDLLHNILSEMCFSYSVWWTPGCARVSPSLLLSQGLPPADSYAALIDGNWAAHGWQDQNSSIISITGTNPQ